LPLPDKKISSNYGEVLSGFYRYMKHELIGLFATGRLPERGNMSTRKKLTARTLMLASIFVTITTGFLVTIGLLLWQSMGQQEAVAKRHLQQIALTESLRVQQQLDSALNAARDLGNSAWALHQAGLTERRGLDQLLTDYLHQHPDFCRCHWPLKPMFDGKDAEFAGKADQDPGRYARYVDRDNSGNPALHNLVDYETPGSGDYYLLPRQRQKEVIIEPYIYPYNGVDVMLTSMRRRLSATVSFRAL
jgi:methyl-accepting chemotaxis protein